MKTIVVDSRKNKYDEYIGRASQWGNPFKIGKDGTREEVIEMYRRWIVDQQWLMDDLPLLRGKVLGCHCKPLACHGDVLVELIEGIPEEEKPEVYEHDDGCWYVRMKDMLPICMNTEKAAKMMLRLLKEKKR